MSENLDRDVLFLLHDVARLIRTRADQRARVHGLTRAQWVILRRLELQPGQSQNELAALAEVEPITVGRLVDRLQDSGLVERRPDPKDRRMWRLHLTPAAKPVLRKLTKLKSQLRDEITNGVAAAELGALVDTLLKLKANLTDGRQSLRAG